MRQTFLVKTLSLILTTRALHSQMGGGRETLEVEGVL